MEDIQKSIKVNQLWKIIVKSFPTTGECTYTFNPFYVHRKEVNDNEVTYRQDLKCE